VDRADTGDDRVAVRAGLLHAERDGAVANILVELDEAPGVDKHLDALPGGELALRVLLLLSRLLGVQDGLLIPRAEVGDLAGCGGEVGLIGHAFNPIWRVSAHRGDPAQDRAHGRWRIRTTG
jgi:hypothetical protein